MLAIVLAAVLSTATVATPASAQYSIGVPTFTAKGVNIRTGASTRYTVVGQGNLGQRFCVYSLNASGQRVNGTAVWLYGKNLSTGKVGWVHNSFLGGAWGYVQPDYTKIVVFPTDC